MTGFSIKETLALGWPILTVLLVFSIVTVAVFMEARSITKLLKRYLATSGNAKAAKPYFDRLEQRLAILGTIANAAPFVGLLGTVIGIIRAFHTISQANAAGGGMALVAGGISEALVSTAAGLFVAIPAGMIYNYFTFQHGKLSEDANPAA